MSLVQIISDKNKKSLKIKNILIKKLNKFYLAFIGALGQTRTGTPQAARILSPLCLPISPRGHLSF